MNLVISKGDSTRVSDKKNLDPQFLGRWSPVAFSDEKVNEEDLMTVFEAARWAPSSYNEQPWHLVYADTEAGLNLLRSVMVDANRVWADKAPVLMLLFTKRKFKKNGKENYSAELDSGSAWMSMALQARKLDLHTHAMAGIDHDKAYEQTGTDKEEYKVMCMIALGKIGDEKDLAELPEDQQKRQQLNSRDDLQDHIKKI